MRNLINVVDPLQECVVIRFYKNQYSSSVHDMRYRPIDPANTYRPVNPQDDFSNVV